MTDKTLSIYSCTPSRKEDRKGIALMLTPGCRYVEVNCEKCGCPVWMGQNQKERHEKTGGVICCHPCAVKNYPVSVDDVIPLNNLTEDIEDRIKKSRETLETCIQMPDSTPFETWVETSNAAMDRVMAMMDPLLSLRKEDFGDVGVKEDLIIKSATILDLLAKMKREFKRREVL